MSKLDSDPWTVHLKMVHYRLQSWKVTKHGRLDTSVKIPVCLWTLELVPFHWTTFSLISSVMMLMMKVLMVVFSSMICSEGLVQPKLFKIFPKSMQVSMNPPHYQSWSFQFRKRCTLRSFNQFFVIESDRDTQKENTQVWDTNRTRGQREAFFIGPRSDHSLPMSVTHSLTD